MEPGPRAHLLVVNADVRTLDERCPRAAAVAVRGGRIVAVGTEAACRQAAPHGARLLDCGGRVVVPGFVDPHVHLAAWAAALQAVDCSPRRARSIDDIVRLIRARAAETPPGAWVRAAGYDETALAEGRHPTRWDLDVAAPDHPVRLLHRSGHAAVLNSRALALAGITIATPEPPGTAIDRRLTDGEPSGLLLEMNDLLGRVVPPLPREELAAGMRSVCRRLLAAGVTAVQDMTHTNDAGSEPFLAELVAGCGAAPRLLAPAVGWEAALAGAPVRSEQGTARPVKVMVREVGERPVPDVEELADMIRSCAARGRQVAVHATLRHTVEAVVAAFARAGAAARTEELRHRIEHAGVCPPESARRIAALGLTVVSNPAFLSFGGDRYLRTVATEDLPALYAVGALHAAGVRLAAASDAPVVPAEPLVGIRAAVTRESAGGRRLPGEGLAPEAAVVLCTRGAAAAAGVAEAIGRVAPGLWADLVVLSGEPAAAGTTVERVIMGGAVRWTRGEAAE
jgi:predicted amidohydrolase YtcJ